MEKKSEPTPAPARGLSSMFGTVVPKKAPEPPKKAGGKIKSKVKGAAKPAERKATALALKSSNAKFTVTPSPAEKVEEKAEMDQDVTMGGTGNKKRRRHGFNPYGSRDKARHMQRKETTTPVNPVQVMISGFVPGSEMGLVQYLQLKSKKDWQPLNVQVEQGQMLLMVDGPIVANAIIRLNGYVFGTEQLSIQLYQEAKPALSIGTKKETTIDIMREFLLSRWDKQALFLDLSNMATDPILKRGSIRPPGASNSNAVVGPVMMKLAGEMFPNVVAVSFAHNTLKNVQQISTIAQFLPDVQNISFEGNHMSSLDNLEAISGTGKLKNLKELVLLNNPLREKEIRHGGERKYIRNVLKRFPFLNMLDGAPIQLTEEDQQAILRTRKVLPLDTRPSFFDSEQSQNVAWEFLQKYLHLFDNDRSSLHPLYSENSTFSLSSLLKLRSVQKVKRRQKQRMMQDDNEKLSWKEVSRNLEKGKSSNAAAKHLYCGQTPICEILTRLPTTVHDLSHTQDFLVDAFQLSPEFMQISLHGEFKEALDLPPYSFDRTFLLRPAEPGSPAVAAGWPFVIASDILCVRDYRALNN